MKKFFLFAAAAACLTASAQDFYVIGSSVNGQSWALAAEDAKMTNKGDGVYEWAGTELGTGFKVNDGTWDNATIEGTELVANIGSNGEALVLGEPYYFSTGGETKDIAIEGVASIANPTVILNLNEGTLTVTGEESGSISWYLPGNYNANEWSLNEACELVGGTEGYAIKGLQFDKAGNFKVSDTGWVNAYGVPAAAEGEEPVEIKVDANNLKVTLAKGGNDVPVDLTGSYDVTVVFSTDGETCDVTFAAVGDSGVDGIAVETEAPVYYNLQGVRVANPANGIFVKVAGGKAVKVVVAE